MKKRTFVLLCLLVARHLAIPAAGEAQGHFNNLTDCGQIAWQSKSHTFLPDVRLYSFHGAWWQDNYITGRFTFKRQWEFDIQGRFEPKTGEWTEHVLAKFPGGVQGPGVYQCSAATPCDIVYESTASGTASSDPWLGPPQTSTSGQAHTICVHINGTGFEGSSPCPAFFSSCAFSNVERAALAAEAVGVGTCTAPQASAAPQLDLGLSVMGPVFNGHFDVPGDANAIFVSGCLPCSIEDQASNFFLVDIEKKEWDNERYGFFWLEIRKDMYVDMLLNEHRGVGVAAVRLGLTEPGTYRVRAKSSIKVMAADPPGSLNVVPKNLASSYTPWAGFTAGGLSAEPLRTESLRAEALKAPGQGQVLADSFETRMPDLIVAEFKTWQEGQQIRPGWLVRNVGTRSAPATDLLVCCRHVGQSVCPESFGQPTPFWDRCGLLQIEDELYPKPEGAPGTPGGGLWVFLPSPIPSPPAGSRFEISAKVDSAQAVVELNEENNLLGSSVPSQLSEMPGPSGTAVLQEQFAPAPPGTASLHAGAQHQGTSVPPMAIKAVGLPIAPAVPASKSGSVRTLAAPAVAVRRISLSPTQPRAKEPFSVTIEFVNGGAAASAQSAEYALECTVVSGGGACPIASATKSFGSSIASGAPLIISLPVVAAPGSYRLQVNPLPKRSGTGKTLEFTIPAPAIPKSLNLKKTGTAPGTRRQIQKR